MPFFKNFSVFNASGPHCTTLEELEKIAQSDSDYIVMKSCTLEPRDGNPSPRYAAFEGGSINSMGLPNLGYEKYIEFSHILTEKYRKPVIASIVGMKPEDFPTIVEAFESRGAAKVLEINLSCPNVVGKPQIAYDFNDTREILEKVCKYKKNTAFGIKLPPYFDFAHYEAMALILRDFPIDFITCVNSVGNALVLDPVSHRPLIKPKGGFGGLGGAIIKPVALANARKFYELLGDTIQIVGCGGIVTGVDAYEYSLCGASAIQIGTEYDREGNSVFGRVKREAEEYARSQGWSSIEESQGKLEVL
ncbi:dihydroorotate oxidase [Candidatus Gracilibacteria bacterium]|nr:dihydroorotate oxidase [Candidatus Gracilibacteria bacterium]